MDVDTGGPAYPQWDGHAITSEPQYLRGGMTLRDYFAATALAGWLANSSILDAIDRIEDGDKAREQIARTMYAFSDAMLKERAK